MDPFDTAGLLANDPRYCTGTVLLSIERLGQGRGLYLVYAVLYPGFNDERASRQKKNRKGKRKKENEIKSREESKEE